MSRTSAAGASVNVMATIHRLRPSTASAAAMAASRAAWKPTATAATAPARAGTPAAGGIWAAPVGYGEDRYGEYGEGQQRGSGSRERFVGAGERERWGDWHQEGRAGRGSEWSSQQGSRGERRMGPGPQPEGRADWSQGCARAAGKASSGTGSMQEQNPRMQERSRQMSGQWPNTSRSSGAPWEEPSHSPDMRTHYPGAYGVSDYETVRRSAGHPQLGGPASARGPAAGCYGGYGGANRSAGFDRAGYDRDDRAYEQFTGANERSSLNRGYGGAGGFGGGACPARGAQGLPAARTNAFAKTSASA